MARTAQSEEMKFANSVDRALNSFSLKPSLFAYFISSRHTQVQQALFNCMIACVELWANRYDEGAHRSDEEFNLYARAKRVHDALLKG